MRELVVAGRPPLRIGTFGKMTFVLEASGAVRWNNVTLTMASMEWTFTAEVIEWRGPSPYFYLPMSHDDSADFKIEAAGLEYWGQVAVQVVIGDSAFTTAVFPKDGRYLVPLRAAIRKAEAIELGTRVTATVRLNHDRRDRPDRPLR
jgi:Domain of unknown function (DUF1905)